MRLHRVPGPAVSALVAVALLAAACGGGDTGGDAGAGGNATRTVEIEIRDIAFDPATVEVRRGETVRFVFTNTGAVAHDALIGDPGAQADHETEMRAADDTGGGHGAHGESGAITVEPGEKGELTHTFDDQGARLQIGCHQPGHFAGGMKIDVVVA